MSCGKILGHLTDGRTPIRCMLDEGHDRPKQAPASWPPDGETIEIPGTPHVARVEVPG